MALVLRNTLLAGVLLIGSLISTVAVAGPILANDGTVFIQAAPGVLNTSPVTDPGGNPVASIPYGDGFLLLEDYAFKPLKTYTPNPKWWKAPGVAYTTRTSGIEISFVNLSVTGFTFNIGANMNAMAWIKAYYNDNGVDKTLQTGWFGGIGPTKTPSYGVYVTQPQTSCAVITRIEIDPTFEWGVGNFGIAQHSCEPVSEPGTGVLMGIGIAGLMACGFVRRRAGLRASTILQSA